MIRVKKFTFDEFNGVLNTCDLMMQAKKFNVYNDKQLPAKLKEKFLDYGYIHYTDINNEVVTIKLSDGEMREIYFLQGFRYALACVGIEWTTKTDYVQILKDRLNRYEESYRLKLESREIDEYDD